MENHLSLLKSISATWLSSSSTAWVTDIILGLLCGLGLFLLLLPCLQNDPPSPPPGQKRNIRKHPVGKRGRPRSRKNCCALKACRDCLRELEGARDLASLLQSHLGKLPDSGGFQQLSCPDPPGEVCTSAPARAHRPHGEHVEDASPTSSPLASPAPMAKHPLPLASTLSVEPQGDQSDLKSVPLGTVPDSSPPGYSRLAPPVLATSALECIILFLSWWWVTAKALFLAISYHKKSQQEPLFHHPPEASFCGDPTLRQVEAGGPPFLHPNVRKLLEMLITKRAELKLWKEKEKEGLFLKHMSPDYPQGSLGNMLKSPSGEQDTTTPPPFWNMRDKAEQLPGPQQLPHPKAVGDNLQQKCSQLFWGLPSLHSESLVAAAWVSRTSSSKAHLSVSFNSVRPWAEAPSQAPQAQPWPHHMAQPQPWPHHVAQPQTLTQTLPQPQPQPQPPPLDEVHAQARLPHSPPDMPYFSLPHGKGDLTGGYRTTCPTSQRTAEFLIPTESEHLEWPLQKRLKWKKILPSLIKNAQEVFSQPTSDLSQDSQASQSHKSASTLPGAFINPEHQQQQEQYTQRSFIPGEHQSGPPWRAQAPGELMQPQGEFPGRGHFQPPVFAAGKSSKNVQKMGSRWSERFPWKDPRRVKDKHPSEDVRQDLERGPEDPCTGSRNTSVKVLEDDEESDSDWIRLQKYKSGNYLLRGQEKQHVEKFLNLHLVRKLGEINSGMIPVQARQSWRIASLAIPESDTHKKPRNLASWKDQKCSVNTSQELFFLDPCTQQMLEAHINRFQVRHRWGSNLQCLEPINLKAQPPPFAHSTLPFWETSEFGDDSIAEVANFLGEHRWKGPGEVITKKKSVLTLTGFLSAPLPVSEDIQRDLSGTQSGENREHSEAPLTVQEGRWPQSLTCSLESRTWQSTTVLGARRSHPELSPSPATARHEPWEEKESMASGDPCSSTAMLELRRESLSSGAEETMEPVEAEEEKTPAWQVTFGASMVANSQSNVNLSSGFLGTSKISPFSRISGTQEPGKLYLKTKVMSKFEFKVEVETKKELQDPATGILLQDCATGLYFRGRNTNILPPTDMLSSEAPLSDSQAPLSDSQASLSDSQAPLSESQAALSESQALLSDSQAPVSGSQRGSTKDTSASQGLCDPTWKNDSSQRQQEPRSPKGEALWKSQSKMLGPTDRELCRMPKPGEQKQSSAGPRTFQASGMSHPAQVREIGKTLGSKYSQFLGRAPGESHPRKMISHSLQCLDPSEKGRGQEDPQQKGKPASAVARSLGPAPRSLSSSAPEVRAIVKLVGEILVDKLGLRKGRGPSGFNYPKKDLQAPVDGRSCYPRGPSHPEQRREMTDKPCSHHATPTCHRNPVKNKWIQDRDSRASQPREALAPASPCQHRPRVARASDHFHC